MFILSFMRLKCFFKRISRLSLRKLKKKTAKIKIRFVKNEKSLVLIFNMHFYEMNE